MKIYVERVKKRKGEERQEGRGKEKRDRKEEEGR
jgi:hypothetical protein